jgi:hypothetical protein
VLTRVDAVEAEQVNEKLVKVTVREHVSIKGGSIPLFESTTVYSIGSKASIKIDVSLRSLFTRQKTQPLHLPRYVRDSSTSAADLASLRMC